MAVLPSFRALPLIAMTFVIVQLLMLCFLREEKTSLKGKLFYVKKPACSVAGKEVVHLSPHQKALLESVCRKEGKQSPTEVYREFNYSSLNSRPPSSINGKRTRKPRENERSSGLVFCKGGGLK
jgi:hypothetical protein